MIKKILLSLLLISAYSLNVVHAENEQGTGLYIQVDVDKQSRVVIQIDSGDLHAMGSAFGPRGFVELTLDATYKGQLIPNWGKAEVSLECNQASVIVYELVQQQYVERAASLIKTDYCMRSGIAQ